MKDVAIVLDEYNNEMFFGETSGECRRWCKENGIDGTNGEYIALGKFYVDDRYFDLEDYETI